MNTEEMSSGEFMAYVAMESCDHSIIHERRLKGICTGHLEMWWRKQMYKEAFQIVLVLDPGRKERSTNKRGVKFMPYWTKRALTFYRMPPYFERNRPAITPRIEFTPTQPHPLPSITPRIEFTAERLQYSDREVEWQDTENNDEQARTSRQLRSTNIPKPLGEPGRPGSGGYCVETELVGSHGWSKEAVKGLTVRINSYQ